MIGAFIELGTARRGSPYGYVIQENGCWDWVGTYAGYKLGYGSIYLGAGRTQAAHRYVYERHVGPIPEGLTLDHLCRNTRCVNPAHLQAVTLRENIWRGFAPPAQNRRKERCAQGHPLQASNLYVKPNGDRICRACQRTYKERWRSLRTLERGR